ncbi:TPA: LexA family transcriptional regulator [Kluyvera ascorbata]|uniref:LexA family transcriptional regulator n=1 Tax=Kluyvera ascorbata TaxID=51288 RepID=UPI00289B7486|nr:LexA family transcriptional regulator [Kluyvera ascorbata]HED3065063.1 LexA family transcriptional regulator [Kluyvera ascorbata]
MSRILNDEQKADALRLKALYFSLKKKLRLSQASIADDMGITQSAVGHYINGRHPLNVRAVSAFARILEVSAEEISPTLARQIAHQATTLKDTITLEDQARRVIVIGRASPDESGVAAGVSHSKGWLKMDDDSSSFAIEVSGNGLWPRIKSGEFIVLEKRIPPEPGDDVVVVLKSGAYLFKTLVSQRNNECQLSDITGKSALPELLLSDDIAKIHYISAIAKSSRYCLE